MGQDEHDTPPAGQSPGVETPAYHSAIRLRGLGSGLVGRSALDSLRLLVLASGNSNPNPMTARQADRSLTKTHPLHDALPAVTTGDTLLPKETVIQAWIQTQMSKSNPSLA